MPSRTPRPRGDGYDPAPLAASLSNFYDESVGVVTVADTMCRAPLVGTIAGISLLR